jgi:hypothetical protein
MTRRTDVQLGMEICREAPAQLVRKDREQAEGNSLLIMADGTAISAKKEVEDLNGTCGGEKRWME